ncbi:MAG: TorF family putative porin [Burkholderiaceae bacterium]|nr:TorF family putative porin [Burkholderiaceae bacterium]
MNKSPFALAMTLLVGFTAQAAADELPVSSNFSLTSNYKYRGQDQTENKPAVQGGFDYERNGFYVGNWNSSVKAADASIEMDFYGGYKGEISKGFGFDVGVLHYYYPQRNKTVELDTTEIYGALSYSIATLKYSHTVSDEYFGLKQGDGTGYWDLSADYEIAKGITLNGHIGSTQLSSDAENMNLVGPNEDMRPENYTDYSIGVTYMLGSGFSVSGAAVGANKKNVWGDGNKGRFIVTLTKAM